MDTSFLYHVYGLNGLKCSKSEYKGNDLILHVEYSAQKNRCPKCGKYHTLVKNGYRRRKILALPIGLKRTILNMKVQRYKCKACDYDQQEKISFTTGGRSYTHRFAKYVVDLLRGATLKQVASWLRISWDTVKEIHSTYLKRHYSPPSLKDVECIGIDEFAVRKGHIYKTIVVDLKSGRILYVGDGKSEESLTKFWKRVKKKGVKIKYVATDMSRAFTNSVRNNAPEAVHIFDHFHVVKLMNEKLDEIRREMVQKETDENKKKLIKGTRYILLANGEDIKLNGGGRKLDNAIKFNEPLSQAYYLKEDLRAIYSQVNREAAEKKLIEWVTMARNTEQKTLHEMADTIEKAKEGILAFYTCCISTGKVEGINNKIKVMKRDAYGFRDDRYFTLRLYALHDCRITRNVG
jgi:transposase